MTSNREIFSMRGPDAWAKLSGNKRSHWKYSRETPGHEHGALYRMSHSDLIVPYFEPSFSIDRSSTVFCVGSCFARHIEKTLLSHGLNVSSHGLSVPKEDLNSWWPNGILNKYTTLSMLNEFIWQFDPARPFPEETLIEVAENKWADFQVVDGVKPSSKEEVLKRRGQVSETYARIRDSEVIIMTLGYVEAWYDKETNLYTNITPPYWTIKRHPERFEAHVTSYEQNLSALEEMYELLRSAVPGVRLLVTVSPVPLGHTFTGKDIMIANTHSKATLRAVAGAFVNRNPNVDYFPSYESILHSVRPKALQEDLCHVSDEMVATVVERFIGTYLAG